MVLRCEQNLRTERIVFICLLPPFHLNMYILEEQYKHWKTCLNSRNKGEFTVTVFAHYFLGDMEARQKRDEIPSLQFAPVDLMEFIL